MSERHDSLPIGCVSFSGDINHDNAIQLEEAMNRLFERDIQRVLLALNSSGGDISIGFQLYSWLTALPIELTTHNTADIDSIANVVFLAGKTRKADPSSRFMLHGAARTFNTQGPLSLNEHQLKEQLNYIQSDHKRIAELIAKKTEFKIQELRRAFSSKIDTIISPQKAVEKKLIHSIEKFQIPKNAVNIVVFTKN